MEKKCKLVLHDEVNASFEGLDPKTRRACYDELKYFIHAARHTPAFKLGRWDGCVSYFAVNGNTYINLLDRVLPIIAKAGWEIEVDDKRPEREVFEFPEIDTDYLVDHLGGPVWPPKHPAAGQQIKLRDHQVDAIRKFVENPQALGEIATGAGKTVITAVLSSLVQPYGRSIVIVPNKDLVKQTESDYKLVGLDTGVYFGDRKELGHAHTICTWQSLDRLIKAPAANKDTLDSIKKDLVAVIVDEAHMSKAQVLTTLLCKTFADVPIRWGMTGTMPREDHEVSALLAGIGPLVHNLGAKELMDKGLLSSCHIHMVQLMDTVEFESYQEEHEYLVKDRNHLEWISEFLQEKAKEGNTLILVDRVETGKLLEEMIPGFVFVYGATKSNERQESYDSFQDENNLILGASYGVAAVGINLPRIFNLVILEPGKSHIRVIQSIGRGIRRAKDKDFVDVYDVSSTCKFSNKHMKDRKKTYDRIEYPYTVTKVDYLAQLASGKVYLPGESEKK